MDTALTEFLETLTKAVELGLKVAPNRDSLDIASGFASVYCYRVVARGTTNVAIATLYTHRSAQKVANILNAAGVSQSTHIAELSIIPIKLNKVQLLEFIQLRKSETTELESNRLKSRKYCKPLKDIKPIL